MTAEKATGSALQAPRGQTQKKTFCRICELHCGLRVDVDAKGALTRIRPDHDHPVSQGYVCAKGTRFLEVANHPQRLTHPLVRQPDGTYQPVSWKEALDYFKARIRPILHASGPVLATWDIRSGNGHIARDRTRLLAQTREMRVQSTTSILLVLVFPGACFHEGEVQFHGLCIHFDQATNPLQLSHAPNLFFALDQTIDDLPCARDAPRSDERKI